MTDPKNITNNYLDNMTLSFISYWGRMNYILCFINIMLEIVKHHVIMNDPSNMTHQMVLFVGISKMTSELNNGISGSYNLSV
jgi:hypothetical protein